MKNHNEIEIMSTDFTLWCVFFPNRTGRICARCLLDSQYLLYYLIYFNAFGYSREINFYFHLFSFNYKKLIALYKHTHSDELHLFTSAIWHKKVFEMWNMKSVELTSNGQIKWTVIFFFHSKVFSSIDIQEIIQYEKWLLKLWPVATEEHSDGFST